MVNREVPCPTGCGTSLPSNLIPRHARRCLGADPTVADLCRVGDVAVDPEGCWVWRATCQSGDPTRYGELTVMARARFGERYAHRLALVLHTGAPIPAGLHALHSCDNPPCIRPEHLRLGTHRENIREAAARGRMRNTFAQWTPEQWAAEMARRAYVRATGRAGVP